MTVDETLENLFPNYCSKSKDMEWKQLKTESPIGTEVEAKVVSKQPFGVFLKGKSSFPILMLPTKTKLDLSKLELNEKIKGKVYVYNEEARQLAITQLGSEEWPYI